MQRPTITTLLAALDNITDTGGILDPATCFVGLFKDNTSPLGPNLTLGDLVEADYTAYARQVVPTWNPATITSEGKAQVVSVQLLFQPGDDVIPNTIKGWFIASLALAGVVKMAELFDAPIPLPDEFHSINLIPQVQLDPDADYGNAVEYS